MLLGFFLCWVLITFGPRTLAHVQHFLLTFLIWMTLWSMFMAGADAFEGLRCIFEPDLEGVCFRVRKGGLIT